MKLDESEYRLERTADGGYLACLSSNFSCCAYGDSAEEAVINLNALMEEYVEGMYLVESF